MYLHVVHRGRERLVIFIYSFRSFIHSAFYTGLHVFDNVFVRQFVPLCIGPFATTAIPNPRWSSHLPYPPPPLITLTNSPHPHQHSPPPPPPSHPPTTLTPPPPPQRCVVVQEVFPDGLVAQDGRLQPGDQIIEVDGVDMTSATHQAVCQSLRRPQAVLRLGVYRERIEAQRTLSPSTMGAAPDPATHHVQPGGFGGLSGVIVLIIIFVLFYYFFQIGWIDFVIR